ncbi:NAD(P)-binding domain-containing protein [Ponticaulis sp.]|uniref:flavin-containing monooxygenase n=1 Tax=Ponticaulis sp. TaxID=2020902 RepID=UPI000B628473|nr:NAD(P)-binding domain-containing protein [Ponticaulis sp.]MAI90238.1 monooxygenase [Ponticaulis sp.]OUX99884.1 MAG: monooxygenase [Hyphomonadaceae bacterium TMED5]|tara:strand:- start:213028 stop:214407 length:1380 start_codon:yes stop_codon:yes gene_type:complete
MAYEGHPKLPKACIIGAGPSGFTTAKRLKDAGIPYDCFEVSDNIGGNWYYNNPNGMSSCYESLHIDTSKWRLAFEDYPVPEDWPDFPHHAQLLQYFHDYVDHFGVRETITFNTGVDATSRREDGLWQVTLSTGETRLYDVLIVANGHHWDPRIPDEYPGEFNGYQTHSHHYRDPFEPYDFRGKRVMVVGGGNSAMDISSELSQKPIAKDLFISLRRGIWVMPKYMNGKPADKAVLPKWMPAGLGRKLARKVIKKAIGNMEDYGLPKPDHEPLEGHPSVSGEFLTRVGCGDIKVKGAIERLDGDGVVYTDGSREPLDAIIWATGYKISFPFFNEAGLTPDKDNRFDLFKRMFRPGYDNLIFMGLAQPLPTLVNLAEQQSKLAAAYLTGQYALPEDDELSELMRKDDEFHTGHFYSSPRHTIQIDFNAYCRDLVKEMKAGEARAHLIGNALPVPARTREMV